MTGGGANQSPALEADIDGDAGGGNDAASGQAAGSEGGGEGQSSEDLAAKRGWKPKDEYSGPDGKWVDAATFLKRGEDEPALLKANLKRLEAKVEDQARTIRDFAAHHTKTEQRAYERAVKDLEARQAQAVADGNVNEVRAITREITELATEAKAAPAAGTSADPVGDFKGRNAWYGDNEVMTAWADGMSSRLAGQGLNPAAQLAEIEKQAKAKFPDAFGNPRREAPAAVDGGGMAPRRGGGVKSYSDLPAEARTACDRFVKQGLLTKEKYVKDYFG